MNIISQPFLGVLLIKLVNIVKKSHITIYIKCFFL